MRTFIRNHGLSITLLALFALFLGAQSVTGWRSHNADLTTHDEPSLSYASYLTTGHFVEATFENWESEFLQMAAYVLLTVCFVQKGSPSRSSRRATMPSTPTRARLGDEPDAPWPVRPAGWLALYEHSSRIAFAPCSSSRSRCTRSAARAEYNAEQLAHGAAPVSSGEFVDHVQFWFQSFQNWQSEFLAVASLVLLSVVLRQRGSPESKPVAAPHEEPAHSHPELVDAPLHRRQGNDRSVESATRELSVPAGIILFVARFACSAVGSYGPIFFEGFTLEHVDVGRGDASRATWRGRAPRPAPAWPSTHACYVESRCPSPRTTPHRVCPDLRGYGESSKPTTTPDHAPYSKRAWPATASD